MGLFYIHPSQTLYMSIIFTYMAQSESLAKQEVIGNLSIGTMHLLQNPIPRKHLHIELIVPVTQNVNGLI